MDKNMFMCENCGKTENDIITKEEFIPVRGEKIQVNSKVRVCTCGNELFDDVLEEENLSRAYDLYRKKYNILSPSDIRKLRGKYGLPQRTLGKILGWGEITIHRYETGAIPDSSHNKMLRLLYDPKVMKDLLIEAQNSIPKTTFEKTLERIKLLEDEQADKKLFNIIQTKQMYSSIDIESGFKQFDLEKIANVVLYFCHNVSQLWVTKLNKLLFYSDFNFFKDFTISLTGLKYVKLDYGPVPDNYENLLWTLENSSFITINLASIGSYSGKLIKALSDYEPDVFSEQEMHILEVVKDKYAYLNTSSISDISHEEKGWIETPFHHIISYEYASVLN